MFHATAVRRTISVVLGAAVVLGQSAAAVPPASASEPAPRVVDVALGPGGALRGQLVDRQGAPAPQTEVALLQQGDLAAKTLTDQQGAFAMEGVNGGVYLVAAPGAGQICRLWTAAAAPPAAADGVLLVRDAPARRGQTFGTTSLYEWFETHPVLGYTLVTTAIALPIILANLDDDDAS